MFGSLSAGTSLAEETIDALVRSHSVKYDGAGTMLLVERNGSRKIAVAGLADRERGIAMKESMPFPIGSNTKLFIGVVIFQLMEEGKLSLETKVASLYPPTTKLRRLANYRGKNYWDRVTVGMLLNHTAGFVDYLNIYGEDEKAIARYAAEGDGYDFDKLIELVLNFGDARFPPGKRYEYCNTGYLILGDIIGRLTGRDWRDAVKKRILEPLGMSHTYFGTRLPKAVAQRMPRGYYQGRPVSMPMSLANSAGEIVSTLSDLARFIRGWGRGELYKKPETLRIQREKGFQLRSPDPAYRDFLYGYGIMKIGPYYGHGGQTFGFQSFVAYDPESDELIVTEINDGMGDAMGLFLQAATWKVPQQRGKK